MAHDSERLIKCPYCDYEWEDSWEFQEDEGTHVCGDCAEEFNVMRNINITYSTTKVDCKAKEHDFQPDKHYIFKRKYDRGVWHDLPEEKWDYVRIDQCSKCDDREYIHMPKERYFELWPNERTETKTL